MKDPKPYLRCDSCDASFRYQSKLSRHLLTHTKVKQFICNLCNSSFSLNYNLKVHLRIHQGLKPYQCPYSACGKTFTQSNNLTVHIKIHKNRGVVLEVKKDIIESDKDTDMSDLEFSLINGENNFY